MFSSQNSQVSNNVNYIEDVFSTYLYTGTSAALTITNGIDLAGKGGLVWVKSRSAIRNNKLIDTVRGATNFLCSNNTEFQQSDGEGVKSFSSTGFNLGFDGDYNGSGITYASWTFREQPKFFDVVTYTGDGTQNRIISHNLGSTPGCMIVKDTSAVGSWFTWHRSVSGGLLLNTTEAAQSYYWDAADQPTSTTLKVSQLYGTNTSGRTYVAYLFAHDAGGFGLTGTDNVISCGYATGGTTVNLGYEPQWILTKNPNAEGNWRLFDNMRGMPVTGNSRQLIPNTSAAEGDSGGFVQLTSTGFYSGVDAIYIAIRRGPMKVPELGTSVFLPTAFSGNGGSGSYVNGFPTDLIIHSTRNTAGLDHFVYDRLRGRSPQLKTNTTDAESGAAFYDFDKQNSVTYAGNNTGYNALGETYIDWNFRRAPGFFDEVCYTGLDTNQTVNHNLNVAPELIIVKRRNGTAYWPVYSQNIIGTNIGGAGRSTPYINVNFSAGGLDADFWTATVPTATTFTLAGGGLWTNSSGNTYVAYLFATCPGVSKVGSYIGTGALQTVACGFTSGARFVLIKRADSTGDWYVWDSARGITSGNDPYLLLNSTAAEVTGTNYVDTDTTGFKVTAAAPAALNASDGTYIFLAIA